VVGTKFFNTNDSYQTVGDSISPYSMLGVPPPYSDFMEWIK
jgi:hypothetical protein